MEDFAPISEEWLKKAKRRYSAVFVGGERDRIPVDPMMLGHSTVYYGYRIRDFYENPKLAAQCLAHAQERYDLLPVTKYYFAHPWLPELGIKLKPMELTPPVPDNIVVKNPEDADNLHIPDTKDILNGYSYPKLTAAMDYIKETLPGMFVPLAYCPEPVGSAAELCGLEQFFMWTLTERDLCFKLIDAYLGSAITGAEAIAKRYGHAVINTGAVLENSDTMPPDIIEKISPPTLDKMVKGCLTKGAGPQIFYHFCGNHKDDYKLYTKKIVFTPLTIMQIGYWEDMAFPADKMKEEFGRLCAIMACVDTKQFIIENNQKKIYDMAKAQIQGGIDSPSGFILGTTCEVPPYSFPHNIESLVKAANDFGSFS